MLLVYISKPPAEDSDSLTRTLFIQNLPKQTTEESLRAHFSNFGVDEIRLIRD